MGGGGKGEGGGATGEIGSQVLTGGMINVLPEDVQGPMKGATGLILDPIGLGNTITGTSGGKNDYSLTGAKGGKGGKGGGGGSQDQPLVVANPDNVNPSFLGPSPGASFTSSVKKASTPEDARSAAQVGKPVADLGIYRTLLAQAIGGMPGAST